MKRQMIWIAIGALGCVLAWKAAPLFRPSSVAMRDVHGEAQVPPGPHPPPGSVLVKVSMVGFDPAEIDARAGEPLKLAFFRPNAANCAREVIFPDLGIRKDLPPGETVVVEITPGKSGPLVFQCGMKMLKGKLIVQ